MSKLDRDASTVMDYDHKLTVFTVWGSVVFGLISVLMFATNIFVDVGFVAVVLYIFFLLSAAAFGLRCVLAYRTYRVAEDAKAYNKDDLYKSLYKANRDGLVSILALCFVVITSANSYNDSISHANIRKAMLEDLQRLQTKVAELESRD